ncbi:MAG: DUF4430 domain-containing protein [Defluviitaleaceae bacterium]|nr:DUF4430 domain-containing protein [Defluviitaleaceae bacterium]
MKKPAILWTTIAIAVVIIVAFFFARSGTQETYELRESFTVTLSVNANTIPHHELVPEDGVIFHATEVTAYEGESVFDVLNREMRNAGIHLVVRRTPIFDSVYIEAINNIFEFDEGPLSGWKYRVNGEFISIGASLYLVQPDDVIEWLYTLDLGRDIGLYE